MIKDQIEELERERGLRNALYPKWVAAKRLSQAKADRCQAALAGAITSLKDLQSYGAVISTNFESDQGEVPVSVELSYQGRTYTYRRETK